MQIGRIKQLIHLIVVLAIFLTPFRVAFSSVQPVDAPSQASAQLGFNVHIDSIDQAAEHHHVMGMMENTACEKQCTDCASCSMVFSSYHIHIVPVLEVLPDQAWLPFADAELETMFDPPR